MGKYTAYGGEVDEYIKREYLDKIVKSFVKDCDPVSVVLFGGFGKGEGSVYFVDGKPVPFNDFDLYVVTKEKMSEEELDEMSMNASKEIGMGGLEIAYFPNDSYDVKKHFHVDVRCLPMGKLDELMNIQRYYELKYGSQVIYGDELILDKMNEIKRESLPDSDGLRNMFNKLHTMLLGLQGEYNEDSERVRIFWSYKSYMSICEALLISEKKFEATSRERAMRFEEIFDYSFPELRKKIPGLVSKVKIATEFKLKPDFNMDVEKLWDEALRDILVVFEYYVERMTGLDNVGDAINGKLPYTYFAPFLKEKIGFNFFPAQYVLNLGYVNVLRSEKELYLRPLFQWKDVGLRLILPIYYLLKYKSSGDDEWLEKAYLELKEFIRVDEKGFWYLKERALRAYGLYYAQRLL
jgi:hypothetical protein|tara:strand:+ start:2958 stop:4181 length:1224 start_codon:yes stop_codon:yes gene_type:complete